MLTCLAYGDSVTIGGIEHGRKAGIDYDSWQFFNFDGR